MNELAELRGAPRFSATYEWGGFLFGVTPATFALYAGGDAAVHFDREGRWTRASLGGRMLLRGLDGRVLLRLGPNGDEALASEACRAVHAEIQAMALAATPGAPERVAADVATLAAWTPERLAAEATRFLEAYRPVGIVTPDRYKSLVVQATAGCAWNGCLFCSLYRKQQARVRSLPELREHIARVVAFVGSGVERRRGIFLGEANALATPQTDLLAMFDVLGEALPELVRARGPVGGVASFIDAFTETDKGAEEYAALRQKGLTRVFLGVESGDEDVLHFLRKPATRAGVAATVEALKAGGLSVGVILLVGAGGAEWSARHVERSASLVHALPLDARDVVYLSALVTEPGGRFDREAAREGLTLLAPHALAAEEASLRASLRGTPAKLARYDVRRFIYA